MEIIKFKTGRERERESVHACTCTHAGGLTVVCDHSLATPGSLNDFQTIGRVPVIISVETG